MSTAAQPAATSEPRPLFTTIVVSTPVVLTVIATFILGRSSSEMTQAQYQRAVASQNQSKVANQWSFFQAKRIRGTAYEVTGDLLLAQQTREFTRDTLAEVADDVVALIGATAKSPPDPKLASALQDLLQKAEQSRDRLRAALSPPADGWKGKNATLKPDAVKAAFDALESYPETKTNGAGVTIDPDQLRLLNEVLDDIRKFRPEDEIAPKTLGITDETLLKAREKAKTNAAKVNERGRSIERVLEEFDVLVAEQTRIVREFQRWLETQIAAQPKGKDTTELRERLSQLGRDLQHLQVDYKAARYSFAARRYEDDARSNQEAAYLYDVEVLKSSARSDRHLGRSFGFMIAMLVAQAGVTVGSLALALRFKLPAWLLAVLAGLGALAYATVVYMELRVFE